MTTKIISEILNSYGATKASREERWERIVTARAEVLVSENSVLRRWLYGLDDPITVSLPLVSISV